jgi:hypothetical protein
VYDTDAAHVDTWLSDEVIGVIDKECGYQLARYIGVSTVHGDTKETLTPGLRLKLHFVQQLPDLSFETLVNLLKQALAEPPPLLTDQTYAHTTLHPLATMSDADHRAVCAVPGYLSAITAGLSPVGVVP